MKYDRTTWYSLNDESAVAGSESTSSTDCGYPVDQVNSPDALGEITRPIPNINADPNPLVSRSRASERSRSGGRSDESNSKNQEHKDKWHLHFLKSSAIEKFFLQLSTDEQKSLRCQFSSPGTKDEFVSKMHYRMFTNTEPFDPESLVIDL